MQDDLLDAVHWAVDAGIADGQRVCIMGASYGGYAALMGAVRAPELYRCAISFAGVSNLVSHRDSSDITDTRFGRDYYDKVLGTDLSALRAASPITHMAGLRVPLLIAHGTQDKRVSFDQARELRAELERLGKPYEWLAFQGEEHGFYVDANHEKFLLAVREFLLRHLGPGIGQAAPP